MNNVEPIQRAFHLAQSKWKGCDWPTQFGKGGINLCGLKSAQARLMAHATSGTEATEWLAAAEWLAQIERDAETAEREAETAVRLACVGELKTAQELVHQACRLEKKYRENIVWQALYDAIQDAVDRRALTTEVT